LGATITVLVPSWSNRRLAFRVFLVPSEGVLASNAAPSRVSDSGSLSRSASIRNFESAERAGFAEAFRRLRKGQTLSLGPNQRQDDQCLRSLCSFNAHRIRDNSLQSASSPG
jgi:hypothetical protein